MKDDGSTATKDPVKRTQDPIRAAASAVATAKRERDRVTGRIASLKESLARAEKSLPDAEAAVAEALKQLLALTGE